MSIAPKYRADIDGLRAIAVFSVVIFHAFPQYVPGGFLGVDVFFVISGYLIGGILLREVPTRLADIPAFILKFYARRARRILPALIAVVILTLAIGLMVMTAEEIEQLSTHSIAALLGFANVVFWMRTDYFGQTSDRLPMLMTWSLGVEEQFYIIVPIAMALLSLLAKRLIPAAVAGLIVLSFAVSFQMSQSNPLFAFFMLPARAWELASGMMLAVVHSRSPVQRRLMVSPDITAFSGLLLILASFSIAHEVMALPGWITILPVLGTVLLIQSPSSIISRRLLTSSPFVFVGLISYSWYLWHWPLMALVRVSAVGGASDLAMLVVLCLSFFMAILSWRFVEQPFRRPRHSSGQTVLRYAALLACIVLVPLSIKYLDGLPQRLPVAARNIEEVVRAGRGDCLLPIGIATLDESASCRPRGEKDAVALIGDSHASALGPGLATSVSAKGMRLVQMAKSQCPPIPGHGSTDRNRPQLGEECGRFLDNAITFVLSEPSVKIVVLAGLWPPRLSDEDMVITKQRISNLVSKLERGGKRIILAGDTPFYSVNPVRAALAHAIPARGLLSNWTRRHGISDTDVAAPSPVEPILRNIGESDGTGVAYLPVRDVFCAGRCAFEGNGGLYFIDRHHLSVVGSNKIQWSNFF